MWARLDAWTNQRKKVHFSVGQHGQKQGMKNKIIIDIYNIIILLSYCPTLFYILYIFPISPL